MKDDQVQWPASAVNQTGDDIAQPTLALLRGLELLARPEDQTDDAVKLLAGTPYSLQVINGGALALNKAWATIIAAAGGGGAIWTALKGFYSSENTVTRTALIAGAAVVLAIAILAVALIVRSDVDARTRASVAQYAAREGVATAFLRVAGSVQGDRTPAAADAASQAVILAILAASKGLKVSGPDTSGLRAVTGVRKSAEGLQLNIGNDWVLIDRIESFVVSPSEK